MPAYVLQAVQNETDREIKARRVAEAELQACKDQLKAVMRGRNFGKVAHHPAAGPAPAEPVQQASEQLPSQRRMPAGGVADCCTPDQQAGSVPDTADYDSDMTEQEVGDAAVPASDDEDDVMVLDDSEPNASAAILPAVPGG